MLRPFFFFVQGVFGVSNVNNSKALILTLIILLHPGCRNEPAASNGSDMPQGEMQRVTPTDSSSNPITQQTAEPSTRSVFTPAVVPTFEDVAPLMGVDFTWFSDRVPDRFLLPEVMGGGIGWFDFDLDGWQDLYFANGCSIEAQDETQKNRLYRNLRGRDFQDSSAASQTGDTGYGQGVTIGDWNVDGFPDLCVANYGRNVLYLNQGDGTFLEVSEEWGMDDPAWSTSGLALDLNGDGLPDLYNANYMDVTPQNNQVCTYGDRKGYCGPGQYESVADTVWMNTGTGSFAPASDSSGLVVQPASGLAISAVDLDRDLLPEIYVANDMQANLLLTRSHSDTGEHSWTEIARLSGVAVAADGMNEASMGIAAADFDHDGHIDLYLTHYYQMKNTLYRNLGELLFEDDSLRTGVASSSLPLLGFGTVAFDWNADGFSDIFVANGHVLGPQVDPWTMSPQLLMNDNGRFRDVSRLAGAYFLDTWIGRGTASGDFDNDGDTDLTVSHIDRPVSILRNDTLDQVRSVSVRLQAASRCPPVGARIRVIGGGTTQEQTVMGGGSYLSTSDERLLFHPDADEFELEVDWPNGRTVRYSGGRNGTRVTLFENGRIQEVPL